MKQLVQPDTSVKAGAGWCHLHTRTVFGAPIVDGLNSATKAANAAQYKHHTRQMPNVAVPVWFSHRGDYDGTGVKDWGHSVTWVPGRGFLSSPHEGFGQIWYATLEQVERAFNAVFRFWSEDINGLRVADASATTPSIPGVPGEIGEDMFIANVKGSFYLIVPNGAGKPTAVVLGADSGAATSGIPIIAYTWETSINALKRAVTGL